MNRRFTLLAPIILSLVLLSGCKVRRIVDRSPLLNISENALFDFAQANSFDFRSLNAKLSVNVESEKQNASFKVNLRMQYDSVIWMSITPALGIEAARALVDPDSIKFIDKLKNQYYLGDFKVLDSLLAYSVGFEFLQDVLVGNPAKLEVGEKYTSSVDGLNYVLQSKTRRKLRNAVDLNYNDAQEDSGYVSVIREKKFEKATEKYSENDLIVKTYYLRPGDFRVQKMYIDDVLLRRSLRVNYENFEVIDGMFLPMSIKIEMSSPEGLGKFELQYSRISTNEVQSYPFKIPEKYTPIQ
jgi:hypothetical protein